MSAPKSVVKIKKDSVEYVSSVDQAEYYLFELTRVALKNVGAFVKKRWQKEYYTVFKKHTGYGGNSIYFYVYSNKNTQKPRVNIGLPHTHKNYWETGFYSFFQEFGTSRTPRLGLLQKVVNENIAEIVKIESQYLSSLSEEAERLQQLVDEKEYTSEE